ncbi:MAG: GvpL/GvpF family gas vesicle protein [Candidatus Tectomicrobia bacterium]|nr:GvpL/GvpF family gas vesicle protein [Candidatus Tectomicrobia bacterium]
MGVRLYCIVEKATAPSSAVPQLPELALGSIQYRDLLALTSRELQAGLADLDEAALREQLARHHRVNEAAAKLGAVVPLRFGTIAANHREVRALLKHGYIELRRLLEKVRDRVEVVVHGRLDRALILHQIARQDGEVQRLRAAPPSTDPETCREQQIALGKAVYEAIHAYERGCIAEVRARLGRHAEEAAEGRLLAEEMVLNLGFLVRSLEIPAFRAALAELNRSFAGNLILTWHGPLPPYSFASLQFHHVEFERIDAARRNLGLDEEATTAEITTAYHDLARRFHPDGAGNGEGAETFKELSAARAILLRYCQNYRYSFRREAVARSVIVRATDAAADYTRSLTYVEAS